MDKQIRDLLKWVLELVENRPEDMWDEEGFPTEELERLVAALKEAVK